MARQTRRTRRKEEKDDRKEEKDDSFVTLFQESKASLSSCHVTFPGSKKHKVQKTFTLNELYGRVRGHCETKQNGTTKSQLDEMVVLFHAYCSKPGGPYNLRPCSSGIN